MGIPQTMNTWSGDGPYAAKTRQSVSLQAMEVTARPCSRYVSCNVKLPAITPTHNKNCHTLQCNGRRISQLINIEVQDKKASWL